MILRTLSCSNDLSIDGFYCSLEAGFCLATICLIEVGNGDAGAELSVMFGVGDKDTRLMSVKLL